MAIDFHDTKIRNTYASRDAQSDWAAMIREIVDPTGKRVADVGCGGGIYTQAWAALGAAQVTGVDFSAQMVRDATTKNNDRRNVTIRQGQATATGLPDSCADIVFERALLHHVGDLAACLREAHRVVASGGIYIAQDRTPDDVALAGTPEHIRGYFFTVFPRLLEIENARRPAREAVEQDMRQVGFVNVKAISFWETRAVHANADALCDDLGARTGRSILHELSDDELDQLVRHIAGKVPQRGAVTEKDRWTVWTAEKR
jgi:ubiquinone/menaquinone biosynthesis C-methylase UbiE